MQEESAHKIILRNIDLFAQTNVVLVNPSDPIAIANLQGYFAKLCVVSNNYSLHKILASMEIEVFAETQIHKVPEEFKTWIFFWNKSKNAAWQFLFNLTKTDWIKTNDFKLYLVGGNKTGIKQALKKLDELDSKPIKIDSARHAQLLEVGNLSSNLKAVQTQEFSYAGLKLVTKAGVFSEGKLDKGSEFLLDYLSKTSMALRAKVLDLGCGSGILGAWLLQQNIAQEVLALDNNLAAVDSCNETFAKNGLNGHAIASDIFSDLPATQSFDLIISNPPFHENFQTSTQFVQKFLSQAKSKLQPNGEIILVANAFLPYAKIFSENFKNWQEVATNASFKIYRAKK